MSKRSTGWKPLRANHKNQFFLLARPLSKRIKSAITMKVAFSLFTLVFTAALAHAGGFGGPPPFTNGSPLNSGVAGSYQATARATNLTGVFRFTYINGRQASATDFPTFNENIETLLVDPYNDYVFFVDGIAYRGLVQANINTSSLGGVLDNGAANVPNYFANVGDVEADGITTGPVIDETTIIPGTQIIDGTGIEVPVTAAGASMAGNFNGNFDTSSAYYSFKGTGQAAVTTYRVDLVVTDFSQEDDAGVITNTFTYVPAIVPDSTVTKDFNFRGVRNSQFTTDATTSSTDG